MDGAGRFGGGFAGSFAAEAAESLADNPVANLKVGGFGGFAGNSVEALAEPAC